MKVKSQSEVTQSCLTRSNPMDCSLLGSSVHGIFQARKSHWSGVPLPSLLAGIKEESFRSFTTRRFWCLQGPLEEAVPVNLLMGQKNQMKIE